MRNNESEQEGRIHNTAKRSQDHGRDKRLRRKPNKKTNKGWIWTDEDEEKTRQQFGTAWRGLSKSQAKQNRRRIEVRDASLRTRTNESLNYCVNSGNSNNRGGVNPGFQRSTKHARVDQPADFERKVVACSYTLIECHAYAAMVINAEMHCKGSVSSCTKLTD